MSLAPHPDRIGRYLIRREIGSGGQSRVFEADDPQHHRVVALKLFTLDGGDDIALKAIQREIESLGKFDDHPNIVTLHDSGEHHGEPYLVMTYYAAGSLMDRIKTGPLPVADVLRCGHDIGTALMALHERGIIHRDIKPHNIFLGTHGYVLGDLGIAIDVSGGRSITAGIDMLSPPYAAPEVLEGRSSTRETDMYSLGATLYHALAGRRPFNGKNIAEQQHQILHDPPPSIERLDAPRHLVELIERLLAKQPGQRWSAESFVKRLPDSQVGAESEAGVTEPRRVEPSPVHPPPAPVPDRTQIAPHTSTRRMLLVSAVVVAVLLAAVGLGIVLDAQGDTDPDDSFEVPVQTDTGFEGPVPSPADLTVGADGDHYTLSWAAVEGATAYRLVGVEVDGRRLPLGDVSDPAAEVATDDLDGDCFEVSAIRDGQLSFEPARACLGAA